MSLLLLQVTFKRIKSQKLISQSPSQSLKFMEGKQFKALKLKAISKMLQ